MASLDASIISARCLPCTDHSISMWKIAFYWFQDIQLVLFNSLICGRSFYKTYFSAWYLMDGCFKIWKHFRVFCQYWYQYFFIYIFNIGEMRRRFKIISLWVPGAHRPWSLWGPQQWEWVPSLMFLYIGNLEKRHIPRMQVVSSWWVPFEFWWIDDAGCSDFRVPPMWKKTWSG